MKKVLLVLSVLCISYNSFAISADEASDAVNRKRDREVLAFIRSLDSQIKGEAENGHCQVEYNKPHYYLDSFKYKASELRKAGFQVIISNVEASEISIDIKWC